MVGIETRGDAVHKPRRGKPGMGIVELAVTADCVAVNPNAGLNLAEEGS